MRNLRLTVDKWKNWTPRAVIDFWLKLPERDIQMGYPSKRRERNSVWSVRKNVSTGQVDGVKGSLTSQVHNERGQVLQVGVVLPRVHIPQAL
uniref:Uncharacterized protein n=1 Tax=Trichuris muris TaxID=70415 RepID=A0A5S6QIY5_TRIMR